MPSHACQRCGKEFARKTGVTAHMKRKNPCKPPTALVQKQVNEVLVKVAPHLEVPVAEFRDVSKKFHETLSKDQRQEEGIFFTPKKVREVLFEALNALKIKPQTILEPSFGSGEFLLDARRLYPDATVTGVEKNKTLFDSLKQSNLFCADFMKWKGEPVDLIIGNPPYFVIKEKNPLCMTGRPNIFVAFLYKCLTEHLKEDGFLAFILPTSLMNCSYYQPMRKYIAEHTTVHAATLLTKAGFYDTTQETMLLILQKKKTNDNFILTTPNGNLYITPKYNELRALLKETTNLEALGLAVKTGSVVWNQVKDQLVNDGIVLIYANNIHEGQLHIGRVDGETKKQYIKDNFVKKHYEDKEDLCVAPLSGPAILVNRGYGNSGSNYAFNFVKIDMEKYYVENHVNVIYAKSENAEKMLDRVVKSFQDTRTAQFIEWFVGNGALSAKELEQVLPIF